MKLALGVGFTVTGTLKTGEAQAVAPGFTTVKVISLLPVVFQLSVCGPCPTGLPLIQPAQFQLKVAPACAVPVQVTCVVALVVEGSTQTTALETLKLALGVGFTVTKTVVIGEVQMGEPGLTTCKVMVFTPVAFQLTVWGPCPVGLPPLQPSQFQLKVAPAKAVPFQERSVVAFVVEDD